MLPSACITRSRMGRKSFDVLGQQPATLIGRPSADGRGDLAGGDGEHLGRSIQRGCATRVTKSLLGYGVVAGAVFETAVLVQGLTRHGFSLAHDDASLLSNGPLGWIQIAAFLVSGLAAIAFAVGARRALAGRAGGTWGPG
jgi:hypothetical protein